MQEGAGYLGVFALGVGLTWYVMHDPSMKGSSAPERLEQVCRAIERFASQVPDDAKWELLRETFEGLDQAVMICNVAGVEIYRTP